MGKLSQVFNELLEIDDEQFYTKHEVLANHSKYCQTLFNAKNGLLRQLPEDYKPGFTKEQV